MKVEGRNSVYELISSTKTVDKILVQNGLRDAPSRELIAQIKESGIKFTFAEKSVLDKESTTKKHQGFIALLDGIEDTHNLGSIIRVADCSGVDAIVIGKRRSASVNETVMRISEGSANHVKVCRVGNINDAIKKLKEKMIWVYALELGGQNIYKTNLKGRVAVVIGGEDTGVNHLTKNLCDGIMAIPMYGKINSLNASVATGVAVYEVVRQRNFT